MKLLLLPVLACACHLDGPMSEEELIEREEKKASSSEFQVSLTDNSKKTVTKSDQVELCEYTSKEVLFPGLTVYFKEDGSKKYEFNFSAN